VAFAKISFVPAQITDSSDHALLKQKGPPMNSRGAIYFLAGAQAGKILCLLMERPTLPGGWRNVTPDDLCRPNGSDVKLQAAPTRERTSGATLAAMHTLLTLSVCKRRVAVRLARNQPARPAGAAFGGLSASAAS